MLNNGDLNMVTWEMRVMSGNPRYEASQRLPPFNYAEYAERIGFLGLRVERPEDVAAAWDQALASDRPVVIDAVTDPNVPPLPPHITYEQAKAFSLSMLKRPHDAARVMTESARVIRPSFAPRTD